MASDGPTGYAVFSGFLDWLRNGAPPGNVVRTVKEATPNPDWQTTSYVVSRSHGAGSPGDKRAEWPAPRRTSCALGTDSVM